MEQIPDQLNTYKIIDVSQLPNNFKLIIIIKLLFGWPSNKLNFTVSIVGLCLKNYISCKNLQNVFVKLHFTNLIRTLLFAALLRIL